LPYCIDAMIRTLDRYIFSQLLLPFFVALLTFVVLISGHFLWQATQAIVQHHVSTLSILQFVVLQIPRASVLAIPVATLLACALVVNRLASDSELVAISAGGVSTGRTAVPLLALAALACLGCLADSELLVPAAGKQSRRLITRIAVSRKSLSFQPHTFLDAGNGIHLYAGTVDTRRDALGNLMAFVVPREGPPIMLWTPRAEFGPTGVEINSSQWYCLDDEGSFTSGHDSGVQIDLAGFSAAVGLGGDAMAKLSLGELWRRARDIQRRYHGQGTRYLMELHWRLALSISPLVFALLAVPVTLRLGRRESLIGVLATIVVVFVYSVIMLWMRMLGDAGRLPPAVAAWSLNFIIACLAAIAIRRCH